MEKHFTLRLKLSEESFNKVQEISNILKKRGFRQENGLNIQDVLFSELLKKITPRFKQQFIEQYTPIDFLVKEALKEPSMRGKLNQFLKANRNKNQIKEGGKNEIKTKG